MLSSTASEEGSVSGDTMKEIQLDLESSIIRLVSCLDSKSVSVFKQMWSKLNPGVAIDPTRMPAMTTQQVLENSVLAVGTRVEARYGSDNKWYTATISQISMPIAINDHSSTPVKSSSSSIRYFLQYDDGDVEEGARRLKIRLPGQHQCRQLVIGEEVDALCEALDGLVLPATVIATPESDGTLQDDHYRVQFDPTALSVAQRQVRGVSRGGSRGGSRGKNDNEGIVVLNRRYIFAAFYTGSGPGAAVSSLSGPSHGEDSVGSETTAVIESLKVACAYFQRIAPGSGRVFLLLPPHRSFVSGCGGNVTGHIFRYTAPGASARDVSVLVQRYRRSDLTVWAKDGMYVDMDDDAVTGMLFDIFSPFAYSMRSRRCHIVCVVSPDRLRLLVKSRYGLSLDEILAELSLPSDTSESKPPSFYVILWQMARVIQGLLLKQASASTNSPASAAVSSSGALEASTMLGSPRSPRATQSVLQNGISVPDIYARLDGACHDDSARHTALCVNGQCSDSGLPWDELTIVEEEVSSSGDACRLVRLDHVGVLWKSGARSVWTPSTIVGGVGTSSMMTDSVCTEIVHDVLQFFVKRITEDDNVSETMTGVDIGLMGLVLWNAFRVQAGASLSTLSSSVPVIGAEGDAVSDAVKRSISNVAQFRQAIPDCDTTGHLILRSLCPSAGSPFPLKNRWVMDSELHSTVDSLFSFPRGGELYFRAIRIANSDSMDNPWSCINDFRGASDAEVAEISTRYALCGCTGPIGSSVHIESDAVAPRVVGESNKRERSEKTEVSVPVSESSRGESSRSSAISDLVVGARVEARYGSGSEWFDATVSQISYPEEATARSDGPTLVSGIRYFLQYDDGDVEEGARRLKIRLPGQHQCRQLVTGEEVDALCEALDGLVLPATVIATPESDGTLQDDHYRVQFNLDMISSSMRNESIEVLVGPVVLSRKYMFGRFF